jgi:hypothetical protein
MVTVDHAHTTSVHMTMVVGLACGRDIPTFPAGRQLFPTASLTSLAELNSSIGRLGSVCATLTSAPLRRAVSIRVRLSAG